MTNAPTYATTPCPVCHRKVVRETPSALLCAACGHDRTHDPASTACDAAGFTLIGTGGGCDAYIMEERTFTVYLTSEGPAAPEALSDECELTMEVAGEVITQRTYSSVPAALADLARFIDTAEES